MATEAGLFQARKSGGVVDPAATNRERSPEGERHQMWPAPGGREPLGKLRPEAEISVVGRIADREDGDPSAVSREFQPCLDQRAADPLPLVPRHHRKRSKAQSGKRSGHPGEHDMPDEPCRARP